MAIPDMGKVVGVDLGEARVGVAVSDSSRVLASPLATITRSKGSHGYRSELVRLVKEQEAKVVVVGLPLSLDGNSGPAARKARAEAQALAELLGKDGVEVEMFDERFTTSSAQSALAGSGRGTKRQRGVVDQVAATIILQAWLERESAS